MYMKTAEINVKNDDDTLEKYFKYEVNCTSVGEKMEDHFRQLTLKNRRKSIFSKHDFKKFFCFDKANRFNKKKFIAQMEDENDELTFIMLYKFVIQFHLNHFDFNTVKSETKKNEEIILCINHFFVDEKISFESFKDVLDYIKSDYKNRKKNFLKHLSVLLS